MNFRFPNRPLSRRQLLQWSSLSGVGLLLNGCGLNGLSSSVGQIADPLNQRIGSLMLSQKPVPEFPLSAIEPDQLLINTFDSIPQLDPLQFRLAITGEVNRPTQLSMADIQALPLTSVVMRHVCVEGWAAIVQWGGIRLRDLVALAQPKDNVRYVYFQSADGYYESWDLASALHPQTVLAYQKNGQPLPVENGAPLRLAAPIKLGYKQSKWVTEIKLVSTLLPELGYWVDQGYEWFGGL